MMKKLSVLWLAMVLSNCGTMISYREAEQAASEYEKEMELICGLSDDYGALIDSPSARKAWRAEAERTPGLERLAGVWVFEERTNMNTNRPYTAKSIVIPAAVIHPLQTRQKIDDKAWGSTMGGRYYSMQCEGSRGYLVAFFDR